MKRSNGKFFFGSRGALMGMLAFPALSPDDDGGSVVDVGGDDDVGGGGGDVPFLEDHGAHLLGGQEVPDPPNVQVGDDEPKDDETLHATRAGIAELGDDDTQQQGQQDQQGQQGAPEQQMDENTRNLNSRVEYLATNLQQTQASLQEAQQINRQLMEQVQNTNRFMRGLYEKAQTFQQGQGQQGQGMQQGMQGPPQPPPADAPFDEKLQYRMDLAEYRHQQALNGMRGEVAQLNAIMQQNTQASAQAQEQAQVKAQEAAYRAEYAKQMSAVKGANYAFLNDRGTFNPATGQYESRGQLIFSVLYDAACRETGTVVDAVGIANEVAAFLKDIGWQAPAAAAPPPKRNGPVTVQQRAQTARVANVRQAQQQSNQNLKGVRPVSSRTKNGAPNPSNNHKALRDKWLPDSRLQ